jgi:transposase
MVEGTQGSHHKDGSTKMSKTTIVAAGIDTAKHKLDVAIDGDEQRFEFANSTADFGELIELLRGYRVNCVGIEATGGYERDVVAALRKAGFRVIVLQPMQVRAFAQFRLRRAKTDRIDAGLIAACAVYGATVEHEPPDPRFVPLADLLTFIEQIEEDIARSKTRLEHAHNHDHRHSLEAGLKRLTKQRTKMLAKLSLMVEAHDDLARRRDLVLSIDGIGLRTALALIVRMPELGRLSREEAASLVGVAPYAQDSGRRHGERSIAGGRARLRRSLFAAALPAAFFHNARLTELYRRLTDAGKPHKVALIACVRKLVIFANTVLARGTPWTKTTANA